MIGARYLGAQRLHVLEVAQKALPRGAPVGAPAARRLKLTEDIPGRKLPLAGTLALNAVHDPHEAAPVRQLAERRRYQPPCPGALRRGRRLLRFVIALFGVGVRLLRTEQGVGGLAKEGKTVQQACLDFPHAGQLAGEVLDRAVVAAGDHHEVVEQPFIEGVYRPRLGGPGAAVERVGRVAERGEHRRPSRHHRGDQVHQQRCLPGAGRPVHGEDAAARQIGDREIHGELLHQRHAVAGRPAGAWMRRRRAGRGDEIPVRAVDPPGRPGQEAFNQAAIAIADGPQHETEILEEEAVHRRDRGPALPFLADRHGVAVRVPLGGRQRHDEHRRDHRADDRHRQGGRDAVEPAQRFGRHAAHGRDKRLVHLAVGALVRLHDLVEGRPGAAAERVHFVVEGHRGIAAQALEGEAERGQTQAAGHRHAIVGHLEHPGKPEPRHRRGGRGVVVLFGFGGERADDVGLVVRLAEHAEADEVSVASVRIAERRVPPREIPPGDMAHLEPAVGVRLPVFLGVGWRQRLDIQPVPAASGRYPPAATPRRSAPPAVACPSQTPARPSATKSRDGLHRRSTQRAAVRRSPAR